MENQSIDELLAEGEALLELLPDPNISLQKGLRTGVYTGNILENTPQVLIGSPLIKLAECEVEDEYDPEDIIKLHGSRGEILEKEDIDDDFLQEMGERNAEFLAGSPDLIRRLLSKLQELQNND